MDLWPAGTARRDITHEVLTAHILVLEQRIAELEAQTRAALVLPDEGYALVALEREAIIQALKKVAWYQNKAAKLLHVSPRVLNYRIKILKIKHGEQEAWIRGGNRGRVPFREPALVTPVAVVVPAEPEVAGPRSPYYLYDADGALLAVRSPSNDRAHRRTQVAQMGLIVAALTAYPDRHATTDQLAHVVARTARLTRKRAFLRGRP